MWRDWIERVLDVSETPNSMRRAAWRVFWIALLARVITVVAVHDWTSPHDWEYGVVARSLLAGTGFSGSAWFVPFGPTAFMAPAYVYALYGCLALFHGAGYAALQFIQSVIGAASCVLLALIARRAFSAKASLCAGFVLALYPTHVYLTTSIHPIVLITATLLLCVWRSQAAVDAPTPRNAVLLGLALGAGALTDPAIFCYVPWAIAWPFLLPLKKWQRGRTEFVLISALVMVLVIAPWTYRNYSVFHRFIPVKSQFGFVLWVGNHPGAQGTQTVLRPDGTVGDTNEHLSQIDKVNLARLGEPEAYQFLGRAAVAYMAAHPRETAVLTAKKALYYWWFPTWLTCPQCSRGNVLTQFHHPDMAVWALALVLIALGMIVEAASIKRWIPLLAAPVCYTALYAVINVGSNSRYRIPVECLTLVFAGAALEYIYDCWIRPRRDVTPL
ncbi:MAG: glycosyltransferase family 39 protein [Candidatus Hydrogenedentes bacterium]|nr:glycosyltransferase family 39 protein [Candidatus Hydrogenedentota bacterium]